MAVTISVATQTAWPARAAVTVSGLTAGQLVTVYRLAGGVRTAVRGASAVIVASTVLVAVDAELSFGVATQYVANVGGGDAATSSATTYALTAYPYVLSDAVTGLAVGCSLASWSPPAIKRSTTRFVIGSRVTIVGGEGVPDDGTIVVRTATLEQAAALLTLTQRATSGVIQLRSASVADGVDGYHCLSEWNETRVVSKLSDPRRRFELATTPSEPWAPRFATQQFSLADIYRVYPPPATLTTLSSAFATLADIAAFDWGAV